jgi:hypothetical protein
MACVHAVIAQEPRVDFNRDVRPILSENCFYCHGQDSNKRQGDLRLDLRDAVLAAGVLDLQTPEASGLLKRIHSDDPDQRMPPPSSNRKLTTEQKLILKQWIAEGAPYASHWAFVAPTKSPLPVSNNSTWACNPIDRFILSRLDAESMRPSAEANRTTLIKRLYVDLIGLPPTPEEVDAFVRDRDPSAYENLVDRLLSSHHYGERMALPWLDAARYADSNGFQQDGDTWQWIWRDWVVRALNTNLPFDQFTIWQLAGDLLPDATQDQKIASGFNRNHLLNGEGGAIAEEQRFVVLFDRIDTTATTWLGLTMACAQCHDHKYDPITQKDYYSLLDAFNRVPETGVPQFFSSKIRVGAPFLELPTPEVSEQIRNLEREVAELDKESVPLADAAYAGWKLGVLSHPDASAIKGVTDGLRSLLSRPESDRTEDEKKQIESQLRKHFDEKVKATVLEKFPVTAKLTEAKKRLNTYKGDNLPRVMIMSDDKPRQSHILTRGEYLKPGDKVAFDTPAFLSPLRSDAPRNRLGFAQWLVSDEHPLTARVQVNRMWQHFFGTGLVKTSEDFGVQSEYPIHMPMLDWLAVEFRESGWDVKAMHRLIVTSATYRQASVVTPELQAKDPDNRLYARAGRFRMPSMLLRDWALASASLLDGRLGGKPVYPYQPDGIWESLAITKERDFSYPASHGRDLYRRSLYTFWRRTVGPANMFDASNRQTCRVRSSLTSTPLHALTTLNDPTWVEAARILAQQCLTAENNIQDQLAWAWQRVLGRKMQDFERNLLIKAFEKQHAFFAQHTDAAAELIAVGETRRNCDIDLPTQAAMTTVCLLIYNMDEALTRE